MLIHLCDCTRRLLGSASKTLITLSQLKTQFRFDFIKELNILYAYLWCLREITVTRSPKPVFKFVHYKPFVCCFFCCCCCFCRMLLSRVVYLCKWASWKLWSLFFMAFWQEILFQIKCWIFFTLENIKASIHLLCNLFPVLFLKPTGSGIHFQSILYFYYRCLYISLHFSFHLPACTSASGGSLEGVTACNLFNSLCIAINRVELLPTWGKETKNIGQCGYCC